MTEYAPRVLEVHTRQTYVSGGGGDRARLATAVPQSHSKGAGPLRRRFFRHVRPGGSPSFQSTRGSTHPWRMAINSQVSSTVPSAPTSQVVPSSRKLSAADSAIIRFCKEESISVNAIHEVAPQVNSTRTGKQNDLNYRVAQLKSIAPGWFASKCDTSRGAHSGAHLVPRGERSGAILIPVICSLCGRACRDLQFDLRLLEAEGRAQRATRAQVAANANAASALVSGTRGVA